LLLLALFALRPAAGGVLTLQRAVATPEGGAAVDVTLPHAWEDSFPRFGGLVEYRLAFDEPGGTRLAAIYIPRACSNLEVLVNGQLVGTAGRMELPYPRNCYHPNLFPLPRSLLRPTGNELRVRVVGHPSGQASSRQRASGLSAVQVGPMAQLRPLFESERFWNVTAAEIVSVSLTGLGLAMLGLWAARRRDRYMLFFALFALGWAALTARLFVRDAFLSHWTTEVLICFGFFPVVSCAMQFLLRLAGARCRWVDWALAIQAAVVLLVLLLAPPDRLLPVSTALYAIGAAEFVACVAAFLLLSWRRRRQDFWLVGAVLLQSVTMLVLEMLQQYELLPLPRMHLVHFTMPLVFAVIAVRLIQLFVQAVRNAETVNLQLERRVLEKSVEIEQSWRQIAQLRTEQAAQDERRRIASDLHDDLGARLLTIVQASQRGGDPERVADMARQALEEMRLSVRGMTATVTPADEALADWRAEAVTRLADAGLEAEWLADDPPPDLILPARTHVQVTRILREAVSNAIRHSGGNRCIIDIEFKPDWLQVRVQDNGRGLPPAGGAQRGHGLPNIERRVRNLGGQQRLVGIPGCGTSLVIRVPLSAHAIPQETP
jgi:signal transduction histidine kinase